MKVSKFLIYALTMLTLLACDDGIADDECCGIYENDNIMGTWLLYERGQSPGSGYIIEDVPSSPMQTLKFSNGKVVSTIEGLEEIKFYAVLMDTVTDTQYVALYTRDPNVEENPHSTYSFDLSNSNLKLYFRWCFEGCHMGLRRLDSSVNCISE